MYLIKAEKSIFLLITFFLFSASIFQLSANSSLINQKAPLISGKNATKPGLINLNRLMTEIGYEKDENGRFKEKNGKFILKIKRNIVVINFFSTTCLPCLKEIPSYSRLAETFKTSRVKLIYVNIDTQVNPQKIKRFIARKQIRVPMMLANQKDAIKKYHVLTLPRVVIIDQSGIIRYVIKGFQSDFEIKMTQLIEKLRIP